MIKYKKYIYTIFSIVFVVGIIIYFCQPKHDLQHIKNKGVIKIIVPTDSFYGFEYELLQKYLNTIQVNAKFEIEKEFNVCIQKLKKGECDLMLRLIPTTKTLKQDILFTQPITTTELLLIQNKSNPLKSYYELDNDTLFIEKDSPYLLRLHNLQEEIGLENLNITEVDATPQEIIEKCINNDIRLTIYDEFTFHLLREYRLLNAETSISTRYFLAWALAPNCTTLKNDIDTWLKTFTNSIEYRDLLRKYYY